MQNFRRQHDQLRLVISRVLKQSESLVGRTDVDSRSTGVAVEVASGLDKADAKRCVLAYDKVKELDALDVSEKVQESGIQQVKTMSANSH